MDAAHPPDAHRRYEEMAVAHVLGGLDDHEGRAFREHLLGCPDCRARVGELRALAHDLADVERDERRVKAARKLEVKQRDGGGDGDPAEEPARMVRPRIMTVLGVAAILALSAWNFTLRETVDRFNQDLDRSTEAAAVMEFGTAGDVLRQADGVRGQLKTDRGALVALVDGLDERRIYGLYLLDGAGQTVFRVAVQPTDGRLFSLIDYDEASQRLLLTLPEGAPGPDPGGITVFEAAIAPPAAG